MTTSLNITREELIQLLNEDMVRESQAMAEINKYIDHLDGKLKTMSNPAKTPNVPVEMLHAVLENERKMAEHYRERIRQAEAAGEFELSETLRAIIKPEHELDWSAVLGSNAPVLNVFGSQ